MIDPESRRCTPLIALMSVDFPAPLSPSRASTSPRATSSDTPSSATTAPNRLLASRTSSTAPCAHRVGHGAPTACMLRNRRSRWPRTTSSSTADDDHRAGGDVLPVRVDPEQVQPVAHHGDDQRAGERVEHRAPAAEEAGPADDHGRDRVQLGERAGRGRPGVPLAHREQGRDARPGTRTRRRPRSAPRAPGSRCAPPLRGCRRPRRSSGPTPGPAVTRSARAAPPRARRGRRSGTSRCRRHPGSAAIRPAPISFTNGGAPWMVSLSREVQRQTARGGQHRQRRDERVRQPALDVEQAVDQPDQRRRWRARRARPAVAEPWSRQTSAPTTALSERLEPTDRSIPRVTITSSCPSARTQITADCLSTLPMFSSDRKTSDSTAQHHDQQHEDPDRAGLQRGERERQAAVPRRPRTAARLARLGRTADVRGLAPAPRGRRRVTWTPSPAVARGTTVGTQIPDSQYQISYRIDEQRRVAMLPVRRTSSGDRGTVDLDGMARELSPGRRCA